MRRANGSGTIKRLSKNRRKRFAVYAPAIMDYENGKIIQKLIGTFATRQEAELCLINYNPNLFELSQMTFKQVFDKWIKDSENIFSSHTLITYKSTYNKNLKELDNLVFKDITLLFLQDYVNTHNITTSVKSVLTNLYNYALKYDIVNKNLAALVQYPKKDKKIIRKEFTQEEIDKLVSLFDVDVMAKYLYILIYLGVRIGEFLNITKEDIIDDEFIIITKSKTKSGENRLIPIHRNIKNLIYEFLEINKNERVIFCQENYHKFRYRFDIFNKKYLNSRHTIHDTRHTFASLLARVGANENSIISMIGHSDIKITQKTYTHMNKEDLRKAINMI